MRTLFLMLALCSCGPEKEDYTKQRPEDLKPAEPPPPPKPVRKMLTEAEMGTCHLTASGAVTADQTTPGGRAATNVSYWLSDDERKNMMGVDGFAVNCIGKDIRFSIVPGGGKKDGMPFSPKKYDFKNGKGDANIMAIFGKATLSNVNGTVDVTAFDSHHIAGSVDLEGKLVPGNGSVKVSGTFDLVCPNFKNCDK